MSTVQGVRFFVAKRVKPVVLRVLTKVLQTVGPKDAEDDLWLRDKIDAAIWWQSLCSHAGDWGGVSLSPGLGVQRTTVLEILGSNKAMHLVHPL